MLLTLHSRKSQNLPPLPNCIQKVFDAEFTHSCLPPVYHIRLEEKIKRKQKANKHDSDYAIIANLDEKSAVCRFRTETVLALLKSFTKVQSSHPSRKLSNGFFLLK